MTSNSFWSDLNTQLMVMAAHRYSLGRRSYIVSAAIEWLLANRKHFERNTLRVMLRDTVEALHDNAAGSDYDYAAWREFARKLVGEMPPDDLTWVREAVQHRNKEWPL